jgi:hypothetical protein
MPWKHQLTLKILQGNVLTNSQCNNDDHKNLIIYAKKGLDKRTRLIFVFKRKHDTFKTLSIFSIKVSRRVWIT